MIFHKVSIIIILLIAMHNNLDAQSIAEKNEVFRDKILNSAILPNFGFQHNENFPSLSSDKYVLIFNSPNNRIMEIGLLKAKAFIVRVNRNTDEDPDINYEGGFYSFSLMNWLNWTNQPIDPYPLYVSSYEGEFDAKIEGFLIFLDSAFNDSTLRNRFKTLLE